MTEDEPKKLHPKDFNPEDFDLDAIREMYAEFDERSFAFYERKLKADPSFWPSAEQLIKALAANSKQPIPPFVLDHIRARLDGVAKKKPGPKVRKPAKQLQNELIYDSFMRYKSWLRRRKKNHGLDGWSAIKGADWWQGPPSERAARMALQQWGGNVHWETIQKLAYKMDKLTREG